MVVFKPKYKITEDAKKALQTLIGKELPTKDGYLDSLKISDKKLEEANIRFKKGDITKPDSIWVDSDLHKNTENLFDSVYDPEKTFEKVYGDVKIESKLKLSDLVD